MASSAPIRTTGSVLLISGVDVSTPMPELGDDHPYPDYLVLRDLLRPDILDTHTIRVKPGTIIRLVGKVFGLHWSVASKAFLEGGRYQAIVAAGEDVGLPLALLARLARRSLPILILCHNVSTRRPSLFLGKLKVGSSIRTFQCLSHSQARILVERYGVSPDQIQIIYWHVDHQFFRPQATTTTKRQICSAGMASRDYASLIEATRGLGVDVKIAADSPWFKQALNVSLNDLPDQVEVRSYGTYAALRQLYGESLFVVVPLFNVDFSAGYTVILEAMAMGKAVIVSRIRQQDDFVIDGWNGFYVQPKNISELRARISYLLDHPEEAKRMGKNGRARVEERFTLYHFRQRMLDALREPNTGASAECQATSLRRG